MELDKIRQDIDAIDTQMRELFLARMDLSKQVITEKKRTGGNVYVPERECEVIENRSRGVDVEFQSEYRVFLKQVMNISRTYQYSQLAEQAEVLCQGLDGKESIKLQMLSCEGSNHIIFVLSALVLAGIDIKEISKIAQNEKGSLYQIVLEGNFHTALAKGALLQVFRELDDVQVVQ